MLYIYYIYTPSLGVKIAVLDREREHGRFSGSTERAKRRSKGAVSEYGGASKEHRGSTGGAEREHETVQRRSSGLPLSRLELLFKLSYCLDRWLGARSAPLGRDNYILL